MKAKKRFRLALVGSDSLRGREIKNVLGQKKSGSFDVEFYDPEVKEEYSKFTEFKKQPKVIHGTSGDFLEGIDLAFLGADQEINRSLGLRAAELGLPAIDLSETFNERADVPLLVAGVNDGDFDFAGSWLVADNFTRGSALNAFEIALKILKAKAV